MASDRLRLVSLMSAALRFQKTADEAASAGEDDTIFEKYKRKEELPSLAELSKKDPFYMKGKGVHPVARLMQTRFG